VNRLAFAVRQIAVRPPTQKGGIPLPAIKIDWIEGRTKEQKAQVVKEFTDTMVRVAGATPEKVSIIINDHSGDNLAGGGKLLSD
jgi:4-oxalocrotonate tautomerase